MPFVESTRARIWYESHGAGPAVALCHGAGGNAASWFQQVPVLVEHGLRAITIDHRGFGRSACTSDDYDPTLFPTDLCAVLDACDVERAALVCQSMGGWTGLPMALAHPRRVRALVLCGTPGGVATPEVASAMRGAGERISRHGGVGGMGGPALGRAFQQAQPIQAFLYAQIASFNPGLPPDGLTRLGRVRIAPEDLAGFQVPTLVIAGEQDVLFPPDALRSVAAAIPGAQLAEIAGAGHSTYFELPEPFNALVLEFLSKHG